ncbi:hypothetical protein [Nonomuraea sp. NPDC050643]|uniref:hypothetical protein n=1 Tax=Nonomuraea sp. NPDC050643 TaxID=3155660 RepID=UPI0033D05ADD
MKGGIAAGSDAAFVSAAGVPAAVSGPGEVVRARSPDEFVAVDVVDVVVQAAGVLALAPALRDLTG